MEIKLTDFERLQDLSEISDLDSKFFAFKIDDKYYQTTGKDICKEYQNRICAEWPYNSRIEEIQEKAWKEVKRYLFIYNAEIESRPLTQLKMKTILDEALKTALTKSDGGYIKATPPLNYVLLHESEYKKMKKLFDDVSKAFEGGQA